MAGREQEWRAVRGFGAALGAMVVATAWLVGCGSATVDKARVSWQEAERCVQGDGSDDAVCRSACEAGVAIACTELGRRTLVADPKARPDAIALFDKACRMEDGDGCNEAALMFEAGIDGPGDPALAMRFFRKACDFGFAAGCANLGLGFHRGESVPRDEPRAMRMYEKACDGGDPSGCGNLAYVFHYGIGIEQDVEKARRLYEASCSAGHAPACDNLATLLVSQTGQDTEPERAAALWRAGCDAGRAAACINLGVCLETGLGVPFDGETARTLLSAACEDGHVEGCLQLAVSLEQRPGDDPAAGMRDALRLYRRVCRAVGGPGSMDTRACTSADRLEASLRRDGALDAL